jgi:uncharacterized protein (DUF427 family)
MTDKQPVDYPQTIVPVDHVEHVPRRIRATLAAQTVFDTTRALYVWESANYPQYYVPLADVDQTLLVDEGHPQQVHRGATRLHALQVGDLVRPGAARVYGQATVPELSDTVRFDWPSLDHWYEEDEEVYVHPRNPYTRVDALRSIRSVRVSLEGVELASSSSPVMVFETGLPTRYYLNPTEVHWEHLIATSTVSACPYKGETTGYWSVKVGDTVHDDLAWTYQFPTRQLLPITGLVAFYNEKVDIELDGRPLRRPVTHFS